MISKEVKAFKFTGIQPQEIQETLTEEAALQIKINGKPYTITMRTPGSDRALAAGLLFTERVINTEEDIISISEVPAANGAYALSVDMRVKIEALEGKNLFNRSIASSASCGVCGKIELCDLSGPEKPVHTRDKLDIALIPELLQQMKAEQSMFERTGGSHAAAIFSIDGTLLSACEDIGRHNAVDKAIGDLFLRGMLHKASILVVSGRVSFEIVAKCAEASIPFLLAVSAPSSLAADFCRRNGITLIGFCREVRATVYTHEENIVQHSHAAPIMH